MTVCYNGLMKRCSVCGLVKPLGAFHKNQRGTHPMCAICRGEKRRQAYAARSAEQIAHDRERAGVQYQLARSRADAAMLARQKERGAHFHALNRERRNADARAQYSRVSREAPETLVLYRLRARAKSLGIPFALELADIVIPERCPVLGIPLRFRRDGKRGPLPDSPSVDRIIPRLGYVRGNIRVMSNRANTLINNASIGELRLVVAFLERERDRRSRATARGLACS